MMKSLSLLLISFFLFMVSPETAAQRKSRKQLEIEKKRNLEKMNEAQQILQETTQQKKSTVNKLKVIQEQIVTKNEQLSLINNDIELIDSEIGELEVANQKLGSDLEKLKKQYGEALYRASKKSSQINQLGFLFASPNFRQLVMRFKYLQQYSVNRKLQLRQIQKVQVLIAEKKEDASKKKMSKEQIAKLRAIEAKNLESIEDQRLEVVKELSAKETDIRNEVAERQRSVSKLEGAIANLVNREVRKRNKAREIKADLAKKSSVKANSKAKPVTILDDDDDIQLANSFSASRKQLPWPTKSGFVSERFGVHPHPVLPGVKIKNDGINIQTQQNAVVRSVYDGIVVDIASIQGNGKVVAIQHGNYYTVYTKLKETFVSVNQKVKSRETIGNVATINGVSEINFQIWNNTTKQNPEAWLSGR